MPQLRLLRRPRAKIPLKASPSVSSVGTATGAVPMCLRALPGFLHTSFGRYQAVPPRCMTQPVLRWPCRTTVLPRTRPCGHPRAGRASRGQRGRGAVTPGWGSSSPAAAGRPEPSLTCLAEADQDPPGSGDGQRCSAAHRHTQTHTHRHYPAPDRDCPVPPRSVQVVPPPPPPPARPRGCWRPAARGTRQCCYRRRSHCRPPSRPTARAGAPAPGGGG